MSDIEAGIKEQVGEDGLYADIDLEKIAATSLPLTKKEVDAALAAESCPMCGQKFELNGMWQLQAQDPTRGPRTWDCDSLACAARLFKRMYPDSRGISSSVLYVDYIKKMINHAAKVIVQESHNFQNVYDR